MPDSDIAIPSRVGIDLGGTRIKVAEVSGSQDIGQRLITDLIAGQKSRIAKIVGEPLQHLEVIEPMRRGGCLGVEWSERSSTFGCASLFLDLLEFARSVQRILGDRLRLLEHVFIVGP